MAWQRIRIELARSHDFPQGSTRHGYEMVLPLTADGAIDQKAASGALQLCTIHRFWEGDGDVTGQLMHAHGRWSMRFDDGREEPLHRFPEHRFRVGEYVSVRASRGGEHAFRVVDVRPEPGLTQPGR